MNAHQALKQLPDFPHFAHELGEVLELSRALSKQPGDYSLAGVIAKRMARLGSMVELRDSLDTENT